MKIMKVALHYWFAIVSVLSFLAGWGMLAHSLKPTQPVTVYTASLPALPPIQAFGSGGGGGGGLSLLSPGSQTNSSFPILRSGGS